MITEAHIKKLSATGVKARLHTGSLISGTAEEHLRKNYSELHAMFDFTQASGSIDAFSFKLKKKYRTP